MGRFLSLPFPPLVEHMSDLAEAASFSVRMNTGSPLSFAPDSVADVDVFLGEIAVEAGGSDELAELVFKLGVYVGELVVRHGGGVWAVPPAGLGGWPVVKLASGYYANPIDKAFKRSEPCEQMLLWANAGGSVSVTASSVVCVPPVSGESDAAVGGLFPSTGILPQLVMANVAAAKMIRYPARVVFTVSAGTEQDDISALSPTRP